MAPRLRWRPTRKQMWITAGIVGAVLAAVLIAVDAQYFNWGWSGFGPKTVWDWLQLLIVPIVVAIVVARLNRSQKETELQIQDQRTKTDREIADDNLRESALHGYLDRIADLLLKGNLGTSQRGDAVRTVARAWTLTVLPRLDGLRKRSVLRFLYESELLNRDNPILDLAGADLSGARLIYMHLYGANLNKSILIDADLRGANLFEVELIDAKLANAKLHGANLDSARLSGAYLIGATYDVRTIWPAHFDPKAAGAIFEEADSAPAP